MAYRLFLVILLGIAIAYTAVARRIALDPWTAEELINPRTLPTLLGLAACAALVGLLAVGRPVRPAAETLRPVKVLGVCGMVLVLVATLPWINLWIGLGLLLVALAAWLGERRPKVLIALALAMPIAGYLLVEQLLALRLPG